MEVESQEALKTKTSRVISTVLSPAIRLWLRSQVEQVEALKFNITGGDRQIITGNIPSIAIAASHAIYQGLHLSNIQLEATGIRVNLGQVIKGKPLRLLEPVPVAGMLLLSESDLQASLESLLLATALSEFLAPFLTSLNSDLQNQQFSFSWQQITIALGLLTLQGTVTNGTDQPTPIIIHAGLQLRSPHELILAPFQIQMSSGAQSKNLDNFLVDLGSEVDLQEINLIPGQLVCRGRLMVLP